MTRTAIAIFGSSQTVEGTTDWTDAELAGARIAEAGMAVVTGGYGGTMEAASRGAARAGGHVIGVTAPGLFKGRSGANPYVDEVVEARTLAERIGIVTDLAHGVMAMPGSIGTATEFVLTWNHNHIVRSNGGTRLPAVAVGDDWRRLAELMVEMLGADAADINLAMSVDEAIGWLLNQPEIHRI